MRCSILGCGTIELDLLLRESEEQDEELNLQDSDSDELSDICGASDLYEYDSDVEYADADEGVFWIRA